MESISSIVQIREDKSWGKGKIADSWAGDCQTKRTEAATRNREAAQSADKSSGVIVKYLKYERTINQIGKQISKWKFIFSREQLLKGVNVALIQFVKFIEVKWRIGLKLWRKRIRQIANRMCNKRWFIQLVGVTEQSNDTTFQSTSSRITRWWWAPGWLNLTLNKNK